MTASVNPEAVIIFCLLVKLNKVNCTYGANFMTLAAACAFIVVNLCAETVNCYRTRFTFLDTLHAADTTRRTFLTGNCALVVVFAKHSRLDFFKRHHFDKSLRASLYAHFASLATN